MGMNEWELGWAVQAGQLREALHLADVADRIRLQLQSQRSRETLQATLSQTMRPSLRSVDAVRHLIQAQLLSQSTAKRSRLQRWNKAATAVATKPLRRLQQSRYSGCNKAATAVATAVTAVATKPLRRLQQPLPLQLVTAALHVPQSVAGAARRRPALGEPSRTGLHHNKDYNQSATVATGTNDAVGARAASR